MNDAFQQQQFLDVIDRDEAERRFHAALDLRPLEAETVALSAALGRVLAKDVAAPIDVPSFDRANVDGFAVQAADTFGASEDRPRLLKLNAEAVTTGMTPRGTVAAGTATAIATGAMLPRGADAVVMIEATDVCDDRLVLRRPVAPGANITFAGTDIGRDEVVLRRGEFLTSRETGVLAALGFANVDVVMKPRVAILSTGDELIAPGESMKPGLIYDSNSRVLADAVRELGCEPVMLGIVPDDEALLVETLQRALVHDVVLLSGGTSKGGGDVSFRAVGQLGPPGIVAHGVALKPGKPLCLAVINPSHVAKDVQGVAGAESSKPRNESPRGHAGASRSLSPGHAVIPAVELKRPVPVAVLPGFPTSAIFTFHEFIAPVLRRLAGRRERPATLVSARLPMRVNSERGRTEYLLVSLVHDSATREAEFVAFPMGKGSGSVTAFSRADGFVVIPRQREYLEQGDIVSVHLLGADVQPADLVVIGSHCTGLDFLLGELHGRGVTSKVLSVGSTGGLEAAKRGECDLAGVHLLDPETDTYNRPFLTEAIDLVPGYARMQGIVFRRDDGRFEGRGLGEAIARALADPTCVLVNRNRGSGTRLLIDRLLGSARPSGYLTEARSHNAVAAAVAQGRADWGVAIEPVTRGTGLGFLALRQEQYDFVIPKARRDRPAVRAFVQLLADQSTRKELARRGFPIYGEPGA
ncbi:MAG: molybdopterin biosynthesis protein [Planctomycetes bacterium]|nr:molybdopterin biosynthesis protein [Planctomycetota bacterium]